MRNNSFKQESENKVGGQAAGKQKSHKNEFSRTCKYELWWQRFNKVRRLFYLGVFFNIDEYLCSDVFHQQQPKWVCFICLNIQQII